MKLNEQLQKILSKKHEPSSMIKQIYKGNDSAFRTNAKGNAILLFIGKWEGEAP